MTVESWMTLLQIAVAILLPGVGFIAHMTVANTRAISKLEGEMSILKDIQRRLASIEDAIRKKL